MRKILLLGVASIIGLSGLVVLGSSPGVIRQLLESVQKSQMAGIISSPTRREPKAGLSEANPVPERALKPFEQTSQDIPDHVLYDVIFRLDNDFRDKAAEQEAAGQIPTGFRHYFKDEAGLTDEENLILKQVAIEFLSEVQPVDTAARNFIEEIDEVEKRVNKLTTLQEQRDSIVLSNRDKLANSMGEPAFGRFNQYVHENFALHLNMHQVKAN